MCVKRLTSKAAEAKLLPAVLKEIEKDARWSPATHTMLKQSMAPLAAKYLNKTGVSAEYQHEVTFGFAVVAILRGQSALESKLDTLIADERARNLPAKPEEKKT